MTSFRTLALAAGLSTVATLALAQTTTAPANNPPPAGTAPSTTTPMPSTTAPMGATTTPANPNMNTSTSTTMGAGSSDMGGMKMANSATMAVKFVTVSPAEVMSSKLVGTTVYNNQNENVGEVEDLVIQNGKTIHGVVVSVGGFLGLGESYVVLDPSSIVLSQNNGTFKVIVDTSKDNLKNAPKFTYNKMKKS